MALELLDISQLSSITYAVERATFDDRKGILVLRFMGEYRRGSLGTPDATYMAAVIQQSLSAFCPDGAVLDLRELSYDWGDGILRVLGAFDENESAGPVPLAIAVSDRSRGGLESLGAQGLFDRVEDAISSAHEAAVAWEKEDEESENHVRMYILVRDAVPLGFAMTAAAHAAVAAYEQFRHHRSTRTWIEGVFRKVVCRVNDAEFLAAKACSDHVVLTESALEGQEVAMAFRPRASWPKGFRFYRLYR